MPSLYVDPQEFVKIVMLKNEENVEELQTTLESLDRNFNILIVTV